MYIQLSLEEPDERFIDLMYEATSAIGTVGLFAGAMITETVFAWPGIGKVFLDSIGKRDYLFMMGFTMFLAVLTMLGNLLSDLLYGAVDPRIRLK